MDSIVEIFTHESFLKTFSQRMRVVVLVAATMAIVIIRVLGGTTDSAPAAGGAISIVGQHAPLTRDCPVIGC